MATWRAALCASKRRQKRETHGKRRVNQKRNRVMRRDCGIAKKNYATHRSIRCGKKKQKGEVAGLTMRPDGTEIRATINSRGKTSEAF